VKISLLGFADCDGVTFGKPDPVPGAEWCRIQTIMNCCLTRKK